MIRNRKKINSRDFYRDHPQMLTIFDTASVEVKLKPYNIINYYTVWYAFFEIFETARIFFENSPNPFNYSMQINGVVLTSNIQTNIIIWTIIE